MNPKRTAAQIASLAAFIGLALAGVSGQVWLAIGLAILSVSLFFGAAFCGWACPVGAVQDLLGMVLGKAKFRVNPSLDRILRYVRYGVLVGVIAASVTVGTSALQQADPFNAIYHLTTGTTLTVATVAVLAWFALASLVVQRPFCRYACPYGAALSLTNAIKMVPLRRERSSCVSCGVCAPSCPMGIEIERYETITDLRCNSCMECASAGGACPRPNTVRLSAPSPKRAVVALVGGVVIAAAIAGYSATAGAASTAQVCPTTGCAATTCHASGTNASYVASSGADTAGSTSTGTLQTCPATGCTAYSCHATDGTGIPSAGTATYDSYTGSSSTTGSSASASSSSGETTLQYCPATGCSAYSCHATQGGGRR